MKALSSGILNAQLNGSISPAFKAQVQACGMPTPTGKIRFNRYDWTNVHKNASTHGAKACCASDGSFIMCTCYGADWNNPVVVRWTNPTLDTDFSTWAADGDPSWHPPYETASVSGCPVYVTYWDIAASPINGDVIIVKSIMSIGTFVEGYPYGYYPITRTIKRKESTDYGVTWGSWTTIYDDSGNPTHSTNPLVYPAFTVMVCFESNGDCTIFTSEQAHSYKKTSGSWGSAVVNMAYAMYGGGVPQVVYDTNYVFVNNLGYKLTGKSTVSIDLADATIEINSLRDLSPMQPPSNPFDTMNLKPSGFDASRPSGYVFQDPALLNGLAIKSVYDDFAKTLTARLRDSQKLGTFGKTKISYDDIVSFGTSQGVSGLCKIPNFPLIISICDADKVTFLTRREDTELYEGIFSTGYQIDNPFPLLLCANSEFIFAYNGNQIWMSPLPTGWTAPAAGAGLTGAILEIPHDRIKGHEEHRKTHVKSTFDLTLNNYDGLYNSPGSGGLTPIAKRSQLGYFKGFYINETDQTVETQRYFIDDWGYSRQPNAPEFIIKCFDAWGLLEGYIFPRAAKYNFPGYPLKSVYDIIGLILPCIGATLTYITRSPYITSIYPMNFMVQPNDNAANVTRRLLNMVPDVLKFFGLAGKIMYPRSTDEAVYYYQYPDS